MWNTRARLSRVRLSCQRRQKRSVKAGLAIEDRARGCGRGKVRSAISAAAPQRGAQKSWAGRAVRVGEHRSETCRPSVADKSEPLVSVPAQSPLGDGRGDEHRGDGRGPGERRPDQTSKTAERRRWREGCLQTGAMTARTNARCGLAVSVTVRQRDCHTTPYCASFTSSTGSRGSLCARNK